MFQDVFTFSIYCFLKSFTILCETWTIKRQQRVKLNSPVSKEKLGASRLKLVLSKSTRMTQPQNFRSKTLALTFFFNVTFMQSKTKSVRQIFQLQVWLTNVLLNSGSTRDSSLHINYENFIMDCTVWVSSNPRSKTGFDNPLNVNWTEHTLYLNLTLPSGAQWGSRWSSTFTGIAHMAE